MVKVLARRLSPGVGQLATSLFCCPIVRDLEKLCYHEATTMGPEITVPVEAGDLVLGTWQQIFHLECDIKPRNREIVVTVIGE